MLGNPPRQASPDPWGLGNDPWSSYTTYQLASSPRGRIQRTDSAGGSPPPTSPSIDEASPSLTISVSVPKCAKRETLRRKSHVVMIGEYAFWLEVFPQGHDESSNMVAAFLGMSSPTSGADDPYWSLELTFLIEAACGSRVRCRKEERCSLCPGKGKGWWGKGTGKSKGGVVEVNDEFTAKRGFPDLFPHSDWTAPWMRCTLRLWLPHSITCGSCQMHQGKKMWEHMRFADMSVVSGLDAACALPCHRAVLATCSEALNSMLQTGMKEAQEKQITFPDASSEALSVFLEFIYTSEMPASAQEMRPRQMEQVMHLARMYDVPGLRKACGELLVSMLDRSNILEILSPLRLHSDDPEIWVLLQETYRSIKQEDDGEDLFDALVETACRHLGQLEVLKTRLGEEAE
ncbi:KBTBD3 [Symbiodinium sp. CCMP2592]|nr:KBTBD3 [Symbiodinium sp. CCMP2592]